MESDIREITDSIPTLQLQTQNTVDTEIEAHMESINKAIDEINTLSRDFIKARDEFIRMYEISKAKLAKMYASNRKNIDKARPFYMARDAAYRAKFEHKKSTARLKKATEDLEDAKSAAKTAENVLLSSASAGSGGTSDPDLLSNLNKANDSVIEATRTRDMCGHDQTLCMSELSKTDACLAMLAQQLSKYVLKASNYFDTRDKMQRHLDAEYFRLWEKSRNLQDVKQQHKDMFAEFSAISLQFAQVKGADEYRTKPPDLSQFEEISEAESLDSSYQDLDESIRSAHSYDISSIQSTGSTSEIGGHVTSARSLTSQEVAGLDLSDRVDRTDPDSKNEICVDYDVTFQMDV